jgi:hypothetical protein
MQRKKDSNLTTIAIITVLTLFIWIGIEGFQRFTKKDLKIIPDEILNPLNPTLDKAVFDEIKAKRSLTPEELTNLRPRHLTGSSSTSPSQVSLPETTATNSAQIQQ